TATTDTAPRPGHEDRAAAAEVRPTDASPAAVVQLSREANLALDRGRGPPPPGEGNAELADEGDAPPPAPQRRRSPTIVSIALARYRQVAYDPASTFVSEESPFVARPPPGPAEARAG
ncbi:MAG: hypothetical protein AAF721_26400, partial [Myxococcota bacterium]